VIFKVNTAGYRNVSFRWDLRASNAASKYARLQYTTNGTDFTDFRLLTMPFEIWSNGLTANFTGFAGVDDNPRFAVRLVAEFENTALGAGTPGYVPANPGYSYSSAGTLRFDLVTFTGEPVLGDFTVMSYNILGNGATNWTLTAANVQAVGRQLSYLKPDVIGFQEIPETFYTQWTNFINTWLPGYQLAIGSRTDGGERLGVASRFAIRRSSSWLSRTDLTSFGYAGVFTRELFEAEILLPGFPQPFHFFDTHLKAFSDQASSERRGAEAHCISNYFATAYRTTNALHPYRLVGDMNEDINRPRTYEQQAIQTLTSTATGLRPTTPRNPVTNDERTWSIQNASLTIRFDYILPSEVLFSNLTSSQVFRSDLANPPTPPLLASDSATAADHLPVLMTFRHPYTVPFRLRALAVSNQTALVRWPSTPGARYRVENSTNLSQWTAVVSNLTATNWEASVAVDAGVAPRFWRVARED
jgi:endonuclease/exonuclease/phosphatase family metal-dependent hydrolase